MCARVCTPRGWPLKVSRITWTVRLAIDDGHRTVHVNLLTFNGQPRVVQMRAHMQRVFKQAHVFIERAKEGFNLSGNVNGTSHPIGRFSAYRNRLARGIPPRYT